MPTIIVNHERKPGIGSLAGWRGADGDRDAARRAQSRASSRRLYRATAASGATRSRRARATSSTPTAPIWTSRSQHGLHRQGRADRPPALQRAAAELPPRRARATAPCSRRDARPRARIATYFDPLPFWYPPFEDAAIDRDAFPLHAITQRPMAMYHSWGSQNAWLRQIHGENRLYIHRARRAQLGIADDDWVGVDQPPRPHQGCRSGSMDGVNPDTVWTWNAIGKRAGRLEPRAGRAGGDDGLPAQSPDRRAAAGARRRRRSPTPIR